MRTRPIWLLALVTCGGENAVGSPHSTLVTSTDVAAATVDATHMNAAPAGVGMAVPSCASTPSSPECQMSCGCAGSTADTITLDCICAQFGCMRSIQDAVRDICSSPPFQILQGCGRLLVGSGPGLAVSAEVFDAQSGALIGVGYSSDVPEPRYCGKYGIRAGQDFDCPEAKECSLCGPQQKPFAIMSAQSAVQDVLAVHCGQCHGPNTNVGGLDYIDDVDKLVAAGFIEPLDSVNSPVIRLMRDGSMPPAASGLPPVDAADIAIVEHFIDEPRFWPGVQPSEQGAGSTTPALEPCVYGN